MSKKSYKKLQNRLYREIKRRMLLEKLPMNKKILATTRPIETLRVKGIYPEEIINTDYEGYARRKLAERITDKLFDDGYITVYTRRNPFFHERYAEYEAILMVVRPPLPVFDNKKEGGER